MDEVNRAFFMPLDGGRVSFRNSLSVAQRGRSELHGNCCGDPLAQLDPPEPGRAEHPAVGGRAVVTGRGAVAGIGQVIAQLGKEPGEEGFAEEAGIGRRR